MIARNLIALIGAGVLSACAPSQKEDAQPSSSPEAWTRPTPPPPIDCGGLFRFDPTATFSSEEAFLLWGTHPNVVNMGEGRLAYRAFDYENTLARGEWRAAGLVTARASAAAPEAVGGVIWVKDNASLLSDPSADVVREGDRLVLTVEVGEVSQPQGAARCKCGYVVTLDDRGVLTAGGVEVARTKAY